MENHTEEYETWFEQKGIAFLKNNGLMPEECTLENMTQLKGTISEQKGIAFLKENGLICISKDKSKEAIGYHFRSCPPTEKRITGIKRQKNLLILMSELRAS